MDLAQSTSGLSGRCPEVAVEISPWIWGMLKSKSGKVRQTDCRAEI